ncbi:MAG: YczE/YyaS/YitT family protein [Acidimicrobiales bacterium]
MLRGLPPTEVRRRLPRLLGAFVLLGVGLALTVRADLGLSPWDVLHQGVSERIGLPIGTVGILVGLVVLLLWIPLGEQMGVGTVLNVITIGLVLDATLVLLPDELSDPGRWTALLGGTFLLGPGVALYLSCELGPGPRDGLMTALVDRGWSLRVVRTVMELSVLALGYLMGGTVGVGTVLIAFSLGPNIHFFLDRVRYPQLALTPSSNT